MDSLKIFDSHLHIIDAKFPLVSNNGYVPEEFTVTNYCERMKNFHLLGGAVVSGSFQAFDQSYLISALQQLGPSFVGVTQLPSSVSDEQVFSLNTVGVRAVRFNLKRGGSADVNQLEGLARRLFDLVGWHAELYIDATALSELFHTLVALPAVSIDHLGLSRNGLSTLLRLAERGIRIKATGFGRTDFDVCAALKALYSANPDVLMFGTDLPSTRAPRAYSDKDIDIISAAVDDQGLRKILYENALRFYRLESQL